MLVVLGGGVERLDSMPNSQGLTPTLFFFLTFVYSHIDVQDSPHPWFGGKVRPDLNFDFSLG